MAMIGFLIMVVFLVIGVPLFIVMGGGSSIVAIFSQGSPETLAPQIWFESLNSFILLAVPLFLLAGNMMTTGRMSRYLVEFVDSLIGHLPGGLGSVAVITAMLFAALSGSAPATSIATAAVLTKPMEEAGYPRKMILGMICAAGTIGILIPPSIAMIIYSTLVPNVGVPELFAAGIFPGIICGFIMMTVTGIISWRRGYGVHPPAAWKQRWQTFARAWPILLMPVIILGGIYGGIFTATEAAAVATAYALIINFVFYRQVDLRGTVRVFYLTVKQTGMLFMLLGSGMLLGKVFGLIGLPQAVVGYVGGFDVPPALLMFALIILYLILGMFMETTVMMLVTVPIIFPVLSVMGMDPVHFGVVMVVAVGAGLATPPIGLGLYVLAGAMDERLENIVSGIWPFFLVLVLSMIIFAYIPQISLYLPRLWLGG
ncbi:MAG: TRAP transporter large permease [Chloroflexota bacterium]|nr:TRAP transporter large permease [Chloroflexota bacterium]